jgi:hypothetical protein
MYAPSIETRTGLASSAGWSLNRPSEIQRCDPLVASPIGVITTSNRKSTTRYITIA